MRVKLGSWNKPAILGDPELGYRGGRKEKWMKPVQANEMKL